MGNNNASSDLPNPSNPNNKSGFTSTPFKTPAAPKSGVLPSAKSADPHAKQTTGR